MTQKRKDKQMVKLIIGLIVGIYIGIIGLLNLVDEDDYIRMLKAKAIKAKKEVKQWKYEYNILDGIIDIKDALISELKEENNDLIETVNYFKSIDGELKSLPNLKEKCPVFYKHLETLSQTDDLRKHG